MAHVDMYVQFPMISVIEYIHGLFYQSFFHINRENLPLNFGIFSEETNITMRLSQEAEKNMINNTKQLQSRELPLFLI